MNFCSSEISSSFDGFLEVSSTRLLSFVSFTINPALAKLFTSFSIVVALSGVKNSSFAHLLGSSQRNLMFFK